MNWIESLHDRWIVERRARVLADCLSDLFAQGSRVVDVGSGDGRLAATISTRRPDLQWEGVDVLVRTPSRIPIREFDGKTIPVADGWYDEALFVDVLHHAEDPGALLAEGLRVASRAVIIKDHLRDGFMAEEILRFMDRVGNERFGVALTYNYWSRREWSEAFDAQGVEVRQFRDRIPLYPWPGDWIFGRKLHFVARLEKVSL